MIVLDSVREKRPEGCLRTPAKFAGYGLLMYPTGFPAFPTRRKRSAARFRAFRGLGNVQRRVFELSEASETFSGAFLSFPTRRKLSEASGRLGTRVGAYCIRPTKRPGTGRIHVPGYDHSSLRDVWGAYSIRPYTGTCIVTCAGYVHSGTRPNSPVSADAPGQIRRRPQTPPGGMLWASSRRPTRGERGLRRGLRAARSAGC